MSTPDTVFARLLALYPHAKKTTLRDMLSARRVRLNGIPAKSLKQPLAPTDHLEVTDAASAPTKPILLANGLKLLFADPHIAIIDKPPGLLTATDPSEKRPTVLQLLTDYFQSQNSKHQIHLIHRLDKDASGLLVFARTPAARHALKQQFLDHTITRRYDVLVHGIPKMKNGRLENLLLEDPRTGIMHVITDPKKGRLAILDYVTIQTNPAKKIAHLQCTLHTGRKHQIRIQLKTLGHPVLCDPLYSTTQHSELRAPNFELRTQNSGLRTPNFEPPHRLALHASHLTFIHSATHRQVSFDSQMPASFAHLVR